MASTKPIDPIVKTWTNHFAVYDREFKKWEGRVEKILKRYRDDWQDGRRGYVEAHFNILWSNVQTLIPAVFARLPKPEVTRRFSDQDPVGRVASLLLERAEDYEIQHYPDYRATMRQCVHDRFLGGRGTAWIRYEPHMRAAAMQLPVDGLQVTEDEDEPQEELDYECVPVDYVHWKDFGHTVARTWEEVSGVWRQVYLTKAACTKRFGERLAKLIPMDAKPDDFGKQESGGMGEEYTRACIYEIWYKASKKAIWISKGVRETLDERDDPLGLEEFFPCPRPLYATLTNESLVPVPDFILYQNQANELDILCDRIDGLVKALQVKGVYDASITEIGRLYTEGENTSLIPVKNWAAFSEKNGLKGALDIVDLDPIARALREAYMAFEQVKGQVYEITGISDIIRGQTEASETATAQQIKGQYAQLRLRNMQFDVAQFAAELMQMKAQVMCGKFEPETLLKIAAADQLSEQDKQLIPQAMQLLFGERLQNPDSDAPNPMRSFRIEVASDSMIQIDEKEEKESRAEFLTAMGGFLKIFEPMLVQFPPLTPLTMEMLKFMARGFKAGRAMEGLIDQTTAQLQQQLSQPKPPPVEVQVEKMKQDGENQRAGNPQAQQQAELQMKQAEMQVEQQGRQQEMAQSAQQHTQEMAFKQKEHALDAHLQQQTGAMDLKAKQQKMQLDAISAAQKARQQAMQPKRPQ